MNSIKFSANDRYLITAGEDTSILVWDFNQCVILFCFNYLKILKCIQINRVLTTEREYLKPYLTWSSHSMKINDLFVSPTTDRVVSISADQSCKV